MTESKCQHICVFVTIGSLLVCIIVLVSLLLADKSGHRIFSRSQEKRVDKYTLDTFAKDLFFVWDDGHYKNHHKERKLCVLGMKGNYTIEGDERIPFTGVETCEYVKRVNEKSIVSSEKYGEVHDGYTVYFNVTSKGIYMIQLELTGHYIDYLNYGVTIRQAFQHLNTTRYLLSHSLLSDFPQTIHMMISFKEGDIFFVECNNRGVIFFEENRMKIFKLHG